MAKVPIVGQQCAMELRGKVLRLDVDCGDELMARVLFEDLCERAAAGKAEVRLAFRLAGPKRPLTPAEKQKAYRARKKAKKS